MALVLPGLLEPEALTLSELLGLLGPEALMLPGLLGLDPMELPVWECPGLRLSREGSPLRGQSCWSRSSCLELKEASALSRIGIAPLRGDVGILRGLKNTH